jgi:Na+/H+ antiporter NhaC
MDSFSKKLLITFIVFVVSFICYYFLLEAGIGQFEAMNAAAVQQANEADARFGTDVLTAIFVWPVGIFFALATAALTFLWLGRK